MRLISTRRLVPACVLSAAAMAALIAPGAASAFPGTQCSGENITGSGSSLQSLANELTWGPAFEKSSDPLACSGTQGSKKVVKVAYTKSSSGLGEETWGLRGHAREYASKAFVGTDQPPNATQEKELLNSTTGKLLTIPILQAAVTVPIHLPTGCTGTSTAAPGQIALTDAELQSIWVGAVKIWGAVPGVTCATTPEKETPIKRVVRSDGSGTTAIFMKFLGRINNAKIKFGGAKKTWTKEGEESLNTTWPAGTEVIQNAETESGGKLAEYVAKNSGTIGYAGLADARGKESLPGLPGHEHEVNPAEPTLRTTFWAVLQNGGGTGKGKHKIPATFADPATNGDIAGAAAANCTGTEYVNAGGVKFPPASTNETWNSVTTSVKQKNYAICGFTYILADETSSLLTGFKETEAQSVQDYLTFALNAETAKVELPGVTEEECNTKIAEKPGQFVFKEGACYELTPGGQVLISSGKDYLGLPVGKEESQNVLKIAQEGASKIGF